MPDPDPHPRSATTLPPEAVAGVAGDSYWSVHGLSWERCGAALAEEHAALLAPPVAVGASAARRRPGAGD